MENDEKKELKHTRVSVAAFTLAGIAMGGISFLLNYDSVSVVLGFALLIALSSVMKKALKRKTKFFLGEIFVYLLVWLGSWLFLFNLA